MTTQNVDKARWRSFLAKAQDFLAAAYQSLADERWDPSVSTAIHAGILACDVATVGSIGKRNKGQHDEIAALLRQAKPGTPHELADTIRRMSRLLSIKNVAEYEARRLSKSDAEAALKDAERLVRWAADLSTKFA